MNNLSIIIPSRNSTNLTACLSSIFRHEGFFHSIYVIDDGLAVRPFQDFQDVRYLDGESPFVFARNCNIGINAAGTNDVILMNDDALLMTPRGLSETQKAYYQNWPPTVGLISAASNHVGNPNMWPAGAVELREDPRMVCFVCVFIPRVTIDDVGVLDETFTGYGCDDDDYCLRVRRARRKIGIFDGCVVDHGSLESTFRPGNKGGDFSANLQRFKEKWGAGNMEL